MNRTIFLSAVFLLLGVSAFAQQDPDDRGIQDSLIIGAVTVDSGVTFALVPVYFVTDDSVAFYHIAISYASSIGGIHPRRPGYYPDYCDEDRFDTVHVEQMYIDMIWFIDYPNLACILNTNGSRVQIMALRFVIAPNAPPQLVVLDTTWDDRNGGTVFGLIDGTSEITPAFQPGFIAIGPGIGVGNEEQTPQSISLSQNYPNPFNAQTIISYSLPQSGPVTLSIYNLLGQKVATLFDGIQQAGEHKVVWNAADITSGLYFARLEGEKKIETVKMVLLK